MFIAYLEQQGGCDYTIGCGKRLIRLKADSKEKAIIELKTIIKEDYGTYDYGLEEITLFETSIEENMPIQEWIEENRREEQAEIQKEKDEAEKAEYERLKQKFGDK